MKKVLSKVSAFTMAIILATSVFSPLQAFAKEETIYYLGEGEQVRKDSNYDKDKEIGTGDAHYDWNLGKFCVSGFSGNPQKDDDGEIVFLKNVGDEINLSFLLEQNIDELNGNDSLSIADDKKAYDEAFDISKEDETDFGKGALLIKKTDYQNTTTYQYYMDYLNGVSQGANTDLLLFEEGDYEIALDYQVRENHLNFWKVNTAPTYTQYQILISFKVRNSNCMVYPFDVKTGSELVNTSFTETGFYLDMAKSRYLDINIEKQNYIETDSTFETDTRFNKTATDGEEFTDQGIYIITVHNRYTNAKDTTKKIYVGADPILKAYVTTGDDISYIKEMVNQGATIEDDGTITLPTAETIEAEEEEEVTDEDLLTPSEEDSEESMEVPESNSFALNESQLIGVIVFAAIVLVLIVFIIIRNNKSKKEKALKEAEQEVNPDPEENVEDNEDQSDNEEDNK